MESVNMRLFKAVGLCLALSAASAAGLWLSVHVATASEIVAVPGQVSTLASTCSVLADKTADPGYVLMGETVDISLSASGVCAGDQSGLHVVLVLDSSGSMAGQASADMKDAAVAFVRDLELESHPNRMAGVVEYHSVARTRCMLTSQTTRVLGCIRGVGSAGGSRIDLGIQEGLKVLMRGRSGVAYRESLREVMIVLSDGDNNAGCPPVLAAAASATDQGILVITACLGPLCNSSCLRSAATSPRHYFEAANSGAMGDIFDRIGKTITGLSLRRVTIREVLPPNMEYVPDSAAPPAMVNPADRSLTWEETHIAGAGVTVTYKMRPLEAGSWPTSELSNATFLAYSGPQETQSFNIPRISVLRARAPNP
jgi:uncharacterized protein YegL